MTQYIDKAAVVAEIENLIGNLRYTIDNEAEQIDILIKLRKSIDTIKAKEVNEKSTKYFPHWKPTQEQLSDLYHAATMNSISSPSLKSLYNDLKVIAEKGE